MVAVSLLVICAGVLIVVEKGSQTATSGTVHDSFQVHSSCLELQKRPCKHVTQFEPANVCLVAVPIPVALQ